MNGSLYYLSFPNGKGYIGVTSRAVSVRLKEHIKRSEKSSKLPLYRAIAKHGEPICSVLECDIKTREHLLALEQWAIASFKTYGAGGYNASPGGEMPSAWLDLATPEQIEGWRQAQRLKLKTYYADPANRVKSNKRLSALNYCPSFQAKRMEGINRLMGDSDYVAGLVGRLKDRAKIKPDQYEEVVRSLSEIGYKATAIKFNVCKSTLANIRNKFKQENDL